MQSLTPFADSWSTSRRSDSQASAANYPLSFRLKVKNRRLAFLLLLGFASGCVHDTVPMPAVQTPDDWRAMVVPGFIPPTYLGISSQSDFAQVLRAYAPHKHPKELVVKFLFDPATPNTAQLVVTMPVNAHGNGVAEFEKKQGVWTFVGEWYPN